MEEQSNRGIWIAFILAVVLAFVLGILWFFRGGDLDRTNADLTEARSTLQRVESEVRTARSDAVTASRQITTLENQVRDDARRATDTLATTERRLRSDLDSANQWLAGANADLEQLRSGAQDDSTADLRKELEQARTEVEQLRRASDERIAALTSEIEQAQNRIAELESETTAMLAQPEPTPAPTASSVDSDAPRQEAESQTAAAREEANARFQAAEKDWQERLADTQRELGEERAARAAVVKERAELTEKWVQRLAAKEQETADRMAALQQEAINSRTAAAAMQKAEKEAAAKMELLQSAFVRQSEKLKSATDRFDQQAKVLVERVATLETALAEYTPGGGKFGLSPTGRSVGRIIERINDGPIMLIDTGGNQGIKPGMKFDVYRPIGDTNRYVGMVKVIRVLDEGAMVVSSLTEVNSLVCPKTGRAVFEPGAEYSPFATDPSGKAVKLVCSNTIAMPLEAPAVGDILDNPFFTPNQRIHFSIAPDANDACVLQSIAILGGAANIGQWTSQPDFIISNEDVPATDDGIARVKPAHLFRYVKLPQQ